MRRQGYHLIQKFSLGNGWFVMNSFCQENEDKIFPISIALHISQGVLHGSCSSEFVMTLTSPQLNVISNKKNLEGKQLVKWHVWVPYLVSTESKVSPNMQ